MNHFRHLNDFIDALLANRRPKRRRLSSAEELEVFQMAPVLFGSRADTSVPSTHFVARLRLRLLEEHALSNRPRFIRLLPLRPFLKAR